MIRYRDLVRVAWFRHGRIATRRTGAPPPAPHPLHALQDRFGNAAIARFAGTRADHDRDERAADTSADRFVDRQVHSAEPGLPTPQDTGARVHTSGAAAEAARALHADAFTVGRDIAFAPGKFAPDTKEGQHLIGHELAHVDQQRGTEPHVQRHGEETIPPYLFELHMRIRAMADRRVRFWAEEILPISEEQRKHGVSPLRQDAVFDIPAINWEHPDVSDITFDDEGNVVPAHPNRQTKFQLHSILAGGYELVDILGDGRILIERDGIGYVFDEKMFSFLFGEELPELFKEMEEPTIFIREHPGLVLAMDFGMQFIPAVTAMLFGMPEAEIVAGGAPLMGWESESVAAFDINAIPRFMSEELPAGANPAEMAAPRIMGPIAEPPAPYTFTTPEVWEFDGRIIRVVNTPAGPRAFYRHTGLGGDFPVGAQVGDWVPFDGFFGRGHFVKPDAAFSPSTPLTLLRWGTEENQAIGMWLKSQPLPPAVDVGEGWGLIQQRLQALGVPVRYPMPP